MSAVLFAGPTLYGLVYHLPEGIDCRPPAAAGDIVRAVAQGADRIGLVDGVFGQSRSVWHKEIVYALSHGVVVLGAASMGALRAADCAALGMVPVGGIAEDYLTGRRVADSDVAVLHGPAELGFRPLSIALVDLEDVVAGWQHGADPGSALSRKEACDLLGMARSLHFTDRTWETILAGAGLEEGRRAHLLQMSVRAGPGRKARDALMLVSRLPSASSACRPVDAVVTDHFVDLAKAAGLPEER
jgi:hypothetical protein